MSSNEKSTDGIVIDRISNIDLLIDMVLYLNTHGKGEFFV